MSKLELLELIIIGVIIIAMAIYYTIMAIKNHWFSKISAEVIHAMKLAESSGLKGSSKKEYVLARIQTLCTELGVPYAFIKGLIDKFIEKTIKSYNSMIK